MLKQQGAPGHRTRGGAERDALLCVDYLVGHHYCTSEFICKALQAAQKSAKVDLAHTQLSTTIELRPVRSGISVFAQSFIGMLTG